VDRSEERFAAQEGREIATRHIWRGSVLFSTFLRASIKEMFSTAAIVNLFLFEKERTGIVGRCCSNGL